MLHAGTGMADPLLENPQQLLTRRMLLSANVASSSPYDRGSREVRGELNSIQHSAA